MEDIINKQNTYLNKKVKKMLYLWNSQGTDTKNKTDEIKKQSINIRRSYDKWLNKMSPMVQKKLYDNFESYIKNNKPSHQSQIFTYFTILESYKKIFNQNDPYYVRSDKLYNQLFNNYSTSFQKKH